MLPVLLRWQAPPSKAWATHIAIDASYAAAALLCWLFYRAERPRLRRAQAAAVVFLIFLLTVFTNQVHGFAIDRASSYIAAIPNETLQEQLQKQVVELAPGAAPHSYRFLPNALVLWLQVAGVRFDAARDIYRLLCMLVLYYALYRFARLYTTELGSVIALLLVAAVYPLTFELYIGQLTDPLSHLSFVLGFIFLETDSFVLLLTTVLLGSLAKETILSLCAFYAFFRRGAPARRHAVRALALCALGIGLYAGVRALVLHHSLAYGEISGTGVSHLVENWRDSEWRELFFVTGGAYIPFLIAAWRTTARLLKGLAVFLLPVLFLSSLLFGWLSETRNWMPLVFVLAAVAARYLEGILHGGERAEIESPEIKGGRIGVLN